ncbi:hypothetical protein B0H10DRAFT_2100840 [Mycena sp. CBHHK59/15]|nr:hypothetical protein B0H10DRAFT_2100840 [Mycena sp. CBHHK59/15]
MSSKCAHKPNNNLAPSRALDAQRQFRARRAGHLQALEQRVSELEEENYLMRQQLGMPPPNRPQLGRGPTGRDKTKSYSTPPSPHSPQGNRTILVAPGVRISPLTVLLQPTGTFLDDATDGIAQGLLARRRTQAGINSSRRVAVLTPQEYLCHLIDINMIKPNIGRLRRADSPAHSQGWRRRLLRGTTPCAALSFPRPPRALVPQRATIARTRTASR